MKILIAADMEGVAGVVNWDQVSPDHKEHSRFRKLMTAEVNAAVRGAYEGGARAVFVADGHAGGRNILVEELDSRARLHTGSPSPLSMVEGVDTDVAGAIFIGYHARAGTEKATLAHTWTRHLTNLWLNGNATGETGLNAALCGHFGVPVLMVSGDQAVCQEAIALVGNIETVAVKEATGRFAAVCLPPEIAQKMIYEAARRATRGLEDGDVPSPFCLPTPVALGIDFPNSQMADAAALLPGAQRQGRRINYTATDIVVAFRAMRAALALAA